jgi:diguanylate cyclase (GGDEF)-like protein
VSAPETPREALLRPAVARETILIVGAVTLGPRVMEKLVSAGFALVRTPSAEAALQLSSEQTPAAILLSASAEGDPFGAVRHLRAQERLAFVQICVFAARDSRLYGSEALAAGADDFFEGGRERDDGAERLFARIARARSLAQLALLDPLTELYNRRFLDQRVAAEIARARRGETTLSIALVDLDDFKSVNDRLGHTAGDRTLVAFAQALRSSVRGYDIVCRFGGDEFIILRPECSAEEARAALGELEARCASAGAALPAVTFSAGIAQFPDDGGSWSELFEVADQNVRAAKRRGRNVTIGRDQP